jgi:hypothetical protein
MAEPLKHTVPHTQTSPTSPLQKKVRAYKRTYILLLLTGWAMLASIGAYILLSFSSNKHVYHVLDDNLVMGNYIAADSSGNTIACSVYNVKDSTLSIMVSSDSGRHFERLGGPWKYKNDPYEIENSIRSIKIAPDNKSVVAIGHKAIYIKAANKDSFTCIHNLKFPRDRNSAVSYYQYNKGFCFVPGTDSVYVYDDAGNIFCLSFTKYDSMVVGTLAVQDYVQSLAVTDSKKMYVITYNNYYYRGAGGGAEGYAVDTNIFFSNMKKYAIADFNTLPDADLINNRLDMTIKADTTKKK